MNRSKRRMVQFGTAILAAGALGVFGAAGATSNDFDPATGECVPPVVRGHLGNVFHDLECLIQEARYIFTHDTE